ncbi:hypothetical protein GCM10023084_54760 [Streptomyces lacrimifluminis]|uniref:Uncharacterized protein n=1 Tax=Streptomyces lacrimifluminis TaxID=1500077 RepID=A0A917NVL5_9ACTN|nr:hypothetical protein GCM10012282_33100 [Streptomyces lacrimifluminis]
MGIEDRDDEEIEADHRAGRLAAAREYAPDARLDEELRLRLTGPDTEGGALRFPWGMPCSTLWNMPSPLPRAPRYSWNSRESRQVALSCTPDRCTRPSPSGQPP